MSLNVQNFCRNLAVALVMLDAKNIFKLFIASTCLILFSNIAFCAESFDDWRDGDLVAQNRPGSREALLWSAAGNRYDHIGIVRLTGGGPYVLDLTNTASEVPLEDYIARGTGSAYAIYRILRLPQSSGAGAARAAWQYSDDLRDDFLDRDRKKLTDTELVHRAFQAVGISVGRYKKMTDLKIPIHRLQDILRRGRKNISSCPFKGGEHKPFIDNFMNQKIITMNSIINGLNVTKIYAHEEGGRGYQF